MKLHGIEKTGAWSEISATLNNNFQRIENAVEALNYATRKNKGYFKSVDELRNTVPFANKGEIAYVGTTSPYAIYEWNGQWVDTGEVHTETVELGNYYTKEETDEVIGEWNDKLGNYYTKEETDQIVPRFVEKTEQEIEDMMTNGTWENGVIYYTVEE